MLVFAAGGAGTSSPKRFTFDLDVVPSPSCSRSGDGEPCRLRPRKIDAGNKAEPEVGGGSEVDVVVVEVVVNEEEEAMAAACMSL